MSEFSSRDISDLLKVLTEVVRALEEIASHLEEIAAAATTRDD